jgi:hypothetical protein
MEAMFSFMLRPLYSRGKKHLYLLDRSFGELQEGLDGRK